MPSRGDIDPVDIPWALPCFFLVAYDVAADSFRYRVAGCEIEDVFRRFTGRNSMRQVALSEMLPPDSAALVHRRWLPLAERGDIVYMTGQIYLAADRIPLGERVMLPLSDDGGQVDGFIGYTQCEWLSTFAIDSPPALDIHYIPLSELAEL